MAFDKDNPLETATSEDGRIESRRANAAFRDYARMAVRSLRDLVAHYKTIPTEAPSTQWATISTWSAIFQWVERAKAFDTIQLAKEQAAYEARRRELVETGLALTHERIFKLTNLFAQLEGYLKNEDLVWLKEIKQVIDDGEDGGTTAERIEILKIKFNSPLFEQFRGVLDDISKEMGQRVKKTELSGLNGEPIVVSSPEQMEEIRKKRWAAAVPALAVAEDADNEDGSVIDEAANE